MYNTTKYKINKILKENGINENLKYYKKIKRNEITYKLAEKDYMINKSITKTCKKYNIGCNDFSKYLKSKNIIIKNYNNETTTNQNIFEKIDTEEKAYWLGFLYADGAITKRNKNDTSYRLELCLKESDYNHIYKFKKFTGTSNKISYKKSKLGNSYRISIGGKKLTEDLINKGCVPNKSLILKFPTSDIVPDNLIFHFMRGYFDGDGWIGFDSKKTFHRTNIIGTKNFIIGYCNKLNIHNIENRLRKKGNVYQFEFRKQESNKMLDLFYSNCTIYLDRKYDRYLFKNI